MPYPIKGFYISKKNPLISYGGVQSKDAYMSWTMEKS